MKDLVNRLLPYLHYIILAYGLYGLFDLYELHTVAVEEINNRMPPIQAELAATNKKLKEIDEFKKKAEEFKLRVQEVAKNIETVQSQLPSEINDSAILTFFNTEMTSLNIKTPNVTPGSEDKSNFFVAKDYTLRANGTFLQFLIFLERVNVAERIYNVKSFKLTNTVNDQKGRFQMISAETVIQAYRFNPEFMVDKPAPIIPVGGGAPP